MYNRITLIGRCGGAPEVRRTNNGKDVCEFSLCTSRKYRNHAGETVEDVQWHKIVTWEKTAEIAGRYLNKGDAVCVDGELRYEKWVDKEGVERITAKITCERLTLLPNKRGDSDTDGGGRAQRSAGGGVPHAGAPSQPDDVDDIPF